MKINTVTVNAKKLLSMMEDSFASGRPFILLVTGYSMKPLLRNLRDQVILISPKENPPRVGDIVFFVRNDGSCVLHRIIRKKENGDFVVNGDAQSWTEVIQQDQIKAVATAIKRGRRFISCDAKGYQMYRKIWMKCRGLRSVAISVISIGRRMKQKIKIWTKRS